MTEENEKHIPPTSSHSSAQLPREFLAAFLLWSTFPTAFFRKIKDTSAFSIFWATIIPRNLIRQNSIPQLLLLFLPKGNPTASLLLLHEGRELPGFCLHGFTHCPDLESLHPGGWSYVTCPPWTLEVDLSPKPSLKVSLDQVTQIGQNQLAIQVFQTPNGNLFPGHLQTEQLPLG